MKFHPDKCTVLSANRTKTTIEPAYTLHGQTLAQAESVKYLGVTIQKDGTWKEHIANTTTKASQTLGFLGRNLRISCQNIKEQAYKMLLSLGIWCCCLGPLHQTRHQRPGESATT